MNMTDNGRRAAAEEKGRKWGRKLAPFLVVGALGLGVGAAAAGGGSPASAVPAEPVPAPTVTVTAPAPAPRTVTVEKVPDVCLRALDYAEEGFTAAGKGFDAAGQAFTAISNYDVAGVQAANGDLKRALDKTKAVGPRWTDARDKCRAAGK